MTTPSAPKGESARKPFMYGISDKDGNAYFEESCVAGDPHCLGEVTETLNDYDTMGCPYKVVPLYLNVVPEWISVTERLPEDGQECWATTECGKVHPVTFYGKDSHPTWCRYATASFDHVLRLKEAIAWMPLTKPQPFVKDTK